MCVTVSPSMLLLLGGRTNAESDNATAERDVEAKAAALDDDTVLYCTVLYCTVL